MWALVAGAKKQILILFPFSGPHSRLVTISKQSFKFLCDLAGVPCILVHSDVHQWNRVYVGSTWWNVDVSALDVGDDAARRGYQQILYRDDEMQNTIYIQSQPALTAFAEEVLVPGSSR